MQNQEEVRIGMVNFINTAPIYEIWKQRSHPESWTIVEAPPSVLNKKLAAGEIDLGFVSTYEYAIHPESYHILEDLSISANGSVGSVFIFLRKPVEQLEGGRILLSGQSQTSVELVKIILEEFHHVHPVYNTGDILSDLDDTYDGVLAIGDEALRLVGDKQFPFQLDLAREWCIYTEMPFVFAVCAVRREFYAKNTETVDLIHKEFLHCRSNGFQQLESICQAVAPRIPMHPDECYVYLRAIEHDFNEEKQQALERFFQFLIQRGDAPAAALPLDIKAAA